MIWFLAHLGLALLWTFLSSEPSLASFIIGLVLGLGLLIVARGLVNDGGYVRRVMALGWFLAVFLKEFLVSNLNLAVLVLGSRAPRLRGGFLEYDIRGLRPWETLLLAHCISLTPGTTSVEVAEDGRTLWIHALEAGDPDGVRRGIDINLRAPMLRWTR